MLQRGAQGDEVKDLQERLKEAGYDPGGIDGIFGAKTQAALLHFQEAFDELDDTGVYDDETAGKLSQTLGHHLDEAPDLVDGHRCNRATWSAAMQLANLIMHTPVRYGPGRGLWHDGKMMITYGPGGLGRKSWSSMIGRVYPSFHCSAFTNFFLGWLLKYNELYTHAGNIPSLMKLVTVSPDLHLQPQGSAYRGYGPYVGAILSDGSSRHRTGVAKTMDIIEVFARRHELPSFMVCAQSTRKADGSYKWRHHTLAFLIDHFSPGSPLYRLAADGYVSHGKWSGQAMRLERVDNVGVYIRAIYDVYGIKANSDGSYGDSSKPIAPVAVEA